LYRIVKEIDHGIVKKYRIYLIEDASGFGGQKSGTANLASIIRAFSISELRRIVERKPSPS
jgi:hypothetical protein